MSGVWLASRQRGGGFSAVGGVQPAKAQSSKPKAQNKFQQPSLKVWLCRGTRRVRLFRDRSSSLGATTYRSPLPRPSLSRGERENVSQRSLATGAFRFVRACLPLLPRLASWGEGEGNARASGSGFGTRDLGRIRAALSRSGSLDIIRLPCGRRLAAACWPLALGALILVQGLRPRAGVEEQDGLGLDTTA